MPRINCTLILASLMLWPSLLVAQDFAVTGKVCPADTTEYPLANSKRCDPEQRESNACDKKYKAPSQEWQACYDAISSCRDRVIQYNTKVSAYNRWMGECRGPKKAADRPLEATPLPSNSSSELDQRLKAAQAPPIARSQGVDEPNELDKRLNAAHGADVDSEAAARQRRNTLVRAEQADNARAQSVRSQLSAQCTEEGNRCMSRCGGGNSAAASRRRAVCSEDCAAAADYCVASTNNDSSAIVIARARVERSNAAIEAYNSDVRSGMYSTSQTAGDDDAAITFLENFVGAFGAAMGTNSSRGYGSTYVAPSSSGRQSGEATRETSRPSGKCAPFRTADGKSWC